MSSLYTKNHIPVLMEEVVSAFNVPGYQVIVDVTLGGGGHTRALLSHNPDLMIFGCDWDKRALDQFGLQLQEEFPHRFVPIFGNFAHIYKLVKKYKISKIDGMIADFGTSFMQLFEKDGFSFQVDTPLDMRMSYAHYMKTAADIVNKATVQELSEIFWTYGQEIHGKKIANAIVAARKEKRIDSTVQLAQIVLSVVPWNRRSSIHPATKVFQALRIAVNNELSNITAFLHGAFGALSSGGRLVCISFHSLEDSLVKDFFVEKASEGLVRMINKKPIIPTPAEIRENNASRSAKMRVMEKL